MDRSRRETMDVIDKENLEMLSGIKKTLAEIQLWTLPEAKDPKMILPDHDTFELFYQGVNYLGTCPKLSIKGNIIELKALQSIEVSAEALVELLCDKLKQPIIYPSEIEIKSPPPFISDIDQKLNEKLFWLNTEFNKILALEDPQIRKLCQDYYYTKAYLLMVHLEYNKWEKSLTSHIVKTAEEKVELKKNAEIRAIQDDYGKKAKTEKGRLNTEIEKYKKEYLRFKNIADRQADIIDSINNDAESAKRQIGDLHKKYRDAEDKAADMETKWMQVQKSLLEAHKELEQYDTEGEWEKDITSTPQKPVFKETKTKEIYTLPCSIKDFKKNYKLTKSEDGNNFYESTDGNKEKIPEELVSMLVDEENPEVKTGKGGARSGKKNQSLKRITAEDIEILKVMQSSNKAMSVKEIQTKTGANERTLYRRLPVYVELEKVEKGKEGGVDVYRTIAEV